MLSEQSLKFKYGLYGNIVGFLFLTDLNFLEYNILPEPRQRPEEQQILITPSYLCVLVTTSNLVISLFCFIVNIIL